MYVQNVLFMKKNNEKMENYGNYDFMYWLNDFKYIKLIFDFENSCVNLIFTNISF